MSQDRLQSQVLSLQELNKSVLPANNISLIKTSIPYQITHREFMECLESTVCGLILAGFIF